jgi:AraC family transcriptional activator of pobA
MTSFIPSFELYGELLSGHNTDAVHHETIRERSSRHDWTIRLHRHRRLTQIFLFRTAGVKLRLGEIDHLSGEPILLVVPPGVAHGFRFSEDVVGDVLSLRVADLETDVADGISDENFASGAVLPRSRAGHFEAIDTLIGLFRNVYHGRDPERTELLSALLRAIVTHLRADLRRDARAAAAPPRMQAGPHETQAEIFCDLVERHFTSDWRVDDYARAIGVSAPHLTRICRRVLGVSPKELVRQRRLLEARRLLEYTRLPIAEITHRSGFRDAAFFSRAFRKAFGTPPRVYRLSGDI